MNISGIIKTLFLLLIGMGAGFYFMTYERVEGAFSGTLTPCQQPLTYQIGTIDSRFDVSDRDVREAMADAAALWSDATEETVAIESEDGNIIVNFIYDERQELVDGELRFRERINSEQVRMNQFQRDYDRQRDQFDERSERYVELAASTTRELDSLNDWVRERNEAGGFTESDVDQFERRKAAVEEQQQRVLNERNELDRMAAQINRDTDRLNKMIDDNNRLIDEYNKEYSGENRFTKATYQNTRDGGVITVNMFLNKQELTLILAHELGHALGMDHVSNPRSVMFSQMGGQELFPVVQLTREDREAIRNVCNLN
jgi:hypothetical protein